MFFFNKHLEIVRSGSRLGFRIHDCCWRTQPSPLSDLSWKYVLQNKMQLSDYRKTNPLYGFRLNLDA